MNRYLFLDLDGVLNSHEFFFGSGAEKRPDVPDKEERLRLSLDPKAIERLNLILSFSEAKVVISSSWRLVHSVGEIRRALRDRGFLYAERVIGKTPYSAVGDSTNRRGIEIQNWLDGEENVCDEPRRIVIIDDDRDMGPLLPHLVKTTWQHGLLDEHIPQALKILGVE